MLMPNRIRSGRFGHCHNPSEMVAKEVAKMLNPYLLHMPLTDDEEMPTFAFPFRQ